MKKIFALLVMMIMCIGMNAQKEVTNFLGIPVDGSKSEMIRKIQNLGFKYDGELDLFFGKINGVKATVSIETDNNKVWRIEVWSEIESDEAIIKTKFNNLCRQFENNERYVKAENTSYIISDDEDISYEMSVNNKQYIATYFQQDFWGKTRADREAKYKQRLKKDLKEEYNLTIEALNKMPREEAKAIENKLSQKLNIDIMVDSFEHVVWFSILELHGTYIIKVYFENGYNKTDSENL